MVLSLAYILKLRPIQVYQGLIRDGLLLLYYYYHYFKFAVSYNTQKWQ